MMPWYNLVKPISSDHIPKLNLDEVSQSDSLIKPERENSEDRDFEIHPIKKELAAKKNSNLPLKSQELLEREIIERLGQTQEEAYKKGYELGFEEGVKEGKKSIEQELLEPKRLFIELVQKMRESYSLVVAKNEKEIIELVLKMVECVCKEVIALDPSILVKAIKVLFDELGNCSQIFIIGNSTVIGAAKMVLEGEHFFQENLKGKIEFHINDNLLHDQIFIETNSGRFDLSLETRLRILKDHVQSIVSEISQSA